MALFHSQKQRHNMICTSFNLCNCKDQTLFLIPRREAEGGKRLSVRPSVIPFVRPYHFRVRSISPEPFERFSLNFTQLFPLSEMVCRAQDPTS